MHQDHDFDLRREAPVNGRELVQDLELGTLFEAMSGGDNFLREVAEAALLSNLPTPAEIRYRQAILDDCLHQQVAVRELYDLAVAAIVGEKGIYRSFLSDRAEPLLSRSVNVLNMLVGMLRRLRRIADQYATAFASAGFRRFFGMLDRELDDDYFVLIDHHFKELRFRGGVLISARLDQGNRGAGYVLRTPNQDNRGFLNRPAVKKPSYSMTIPDRDEAGFRSLTELRDHGLSLVANAAAQSADHVLNFFVALRSELAFYVGCLNLNEQLAGNGEPICFPSPRPAEERALTARALYEPCLSLHLHQRTTGNDLDADDKSLIMITGANQGGKSTFLRSLGVAQLMMQCGMFVAAEAFSASVSPGVFTHYKREEDTTMASGKLAEELSRMSDIADHVTPDCLLLCNESIAATNEREGSEIAREVIQAMMDGGARVYFVTHLYDLAHSLYQRHLDTALFLRAERQHAGRRTYRLAEGQPLPTSYGQDLYNRIFGSGNRL